MNQEIREDPSGEEVGKIQIRRVNLHDENRLVALDSLCFGEEAYNAKFMHKCLMNDNIQMWCIEISSQLCAYVMVEKVGNLPLQTFEVLSLAVHPTFRRQKLATDLIQHIFNILQDGTITLQVDKKNTIAQHLYTSLGFRRVSPLETDSWSDKRQKWRMATELSKKIHKDQ
jgi:ribosomal protein S18 acetylase RimI-like enzyme